MTKCTASNERFCEMAGATRPQFCLTLHRQWLVRAVVTPATSPSRRPVGCKHYRSAYLEESANKD
jgi:hypothetical protein